MHLLLVAKHFLSWLYGFKYPCVNESKGWPVTLPLRFSSRSRTEAMDTMSEEALYSASKWSLMQDRAWSTFATLPLARAKAKRVNSASGLTQQLHECKETNTSGFFSVIINYKSCLCIRVRVLWPNKLIFMHKHLNVTSHFKRWNHISPS